MIAVDPSGSIDPADLARRLAEAGGAAGRIVGRRIESFRSIGSTNDRARELASSGEPEGTVVLSDEQTRGRGRGGRTWHSPAGVGLYLSILLRPGASAAEAPVAGLMAAVAASHALGGFSPRPVRIKWPNDILVEIDEPPARPRKVAGILTESRTVADEIRDVVIGIGINVNQDTEDFPQEVQPLATSLRLAAGRPVSREEVALALLEQIDRWYRLWCDAGPRQVVEAFRERAPGARGRRVRVCEGERTWTGITAGVSASGALLVEPDPLARGGPRSPVEVRFGEVHRLEDV